MLKKTLVFPFRVSLEDPRKNANPEKLKIKEEMKHGENVKIAKSLGFDENKIEYVLTKQYEIHEENFASLHDLLNKLLD